MPKFPGNDSSSVPAKPKGLDKEVPAAKMPNAPSSNIGFDEKNPNLPPAAPKGLDGQKG